MSTCQTTDIHTADGRWSQCKTRAVSWRRKQTRRLSFGTVRQAAPSWSRRTRTDFDPSPMTALQRINCLWSFCLPCILHTSFYYFYPSRVRLLRSSCLYAYLLVCLPVCPLACLKKHTYKIHQIFLTCYLGPGSVLLWRQCNKLRPPVLWMTSCFPAMDRIGQNQRRRVCFVQFARWRHRGRSLPSLTVSCSDLSQATGMQYSSETLMLI